MRSSIGVWLVGARGGVATVVAYGAAALRRGLTDTTGLVTARGPCADLDLASPADFVFGGHEVRKGSIAETAKGLVRERVIPAEVEEACREDVARWDENVRPGFLDASEPALGRIDVGVAALARLPGAEVVERLRGDLREFRRKAGVQRLVVVHLASTEALREDGKAWETRTGLERALQSRDSGARPPASVLYAAAAIEEGCAFVNFTPSPGAAVGALLERARERGVPHCGNDGKTGETLVKTALAPMFLGRNLRVLSWEGYNLLGNRDGAVLAQPGRLAAKARSKDESVRRILGDASVHTHVSIDYVPSLSDWKTAWDFVHFRGFLGVPMTLQFVWQGCDKVLAAPLVLDLVRLADLSLRRGEAGAMAHAACFFKAPIGTEEHDLHRQVAALEAYAREVATRPSGPGPGRGIARRRSAAATPRSGAARGRGSRRRGSRTRTG